MTTIIEPTSELSFRFANADVFVADWPVLLVEREFFDQEGRPIQRSGWWIGLPPEVQDDDETVLALVGSPLADRTLRPWRYPDRAAMPDEIVLFPLIERIMEWIDRRRS